MAKRLDRRQLLTLLSACSLTGLSGCNQQPNEVTNEDGSPITEPTFDNPTDTQTATTKSTPGDTTAPEITTAEVQPEDNARKLRVTLKSEDNRIISLVRVWYGSRTIEEHPNRDKIVIEGTLDKVLPQEPKEYGIVHFLVKDAAGNVNEETVKADDHSPGFETFTARPTDIAGELALLFEGSDDNALRTLEFTVNDGEVEKDVLGQESVLVEHKVSVDHPDLGDVLTPGEVQEVSAKLQDWAGNTVKRTEDVYVRKFDQMGNPRINIGAVYIPFTGKYMGKCAENREPSIGHYGDPIPSEITSSHIDQMRGHGVTSILYNYNGGRTTGYEFDALVKSDLLSEIQLQPYYTIGNALKWNEEGDIKTTLTNDLEFIRKSFFGRENRQEFNDKPVVSFFDVDWLAWGGNDDSERVKEGILNEWSNYQNFVQFIRDELSTQGDEPFLVGDFHDNAIGGYPEDQAELNKQFDAATNWLGLLRNGETVSWEEQFTHMKKGYSATREFTDQHDMEFIPNVFPGFNDIGTSDCYGGPGDRRVPRSTKYFRKMLNLADQYRTTDNITIGTWNAWTEGTQIEPGTFKGRDYGRQYLNIVREFQQA